ncbi:MAG: MBL fold metallo-hydrolase [Asticcacaulis sp.]
MRITHISNSFLKIESTHTRLLCDPWVGLTRGGGWHSFPEYPSEALRAYAADCDAIYISHLHSDHFDPDFLHAAGLMGKTFIIKHFENQTLCRRLQNLGASRIIQCPSMRVVAFQDLKLSVIPQMTSNSSGLEDQIDYDLDTSIVVQADGKTLFNQVDNPLSFDDYTRLKAFIDTHFGPLDIACLATGAASAYPQNFVGIDRAAEARRIIDRSLERFSRIIDILKPAHFFPAGGSYIIPGRYADLNALIAQPDNTELKAALANRAEFYHLEGEDGLDLKTLSRFTPVIAALQKNKPLSAESHRHDPYPFDDLDDSQTDDDTLSQWFEAAYDAYSQSMDEAGVTIGQRVAFEVYDHLTFDDQNRITSPSRARYELSRHGPEDHRQTFHLDRRLFISCLTRRINWNEGLPLCLFERHPNQFMPTVDFSLNYLIIPSEMARSLTDHFGNKKQFSPQNRLHASGDH